MFKAEISPRRRTRGLALAASPSLYICRATFANPYDFIVRPLSILGRGEGRITLFVLRYSLPQKTKRGAAQTNLPRSHKMAAGLRRKGDVSFHAQPPAGAFGCRLRTKWLPRSWGAGALAAGWSWVQYVYRRLWDYVFYTAAGMRTNKTALY